MLFDFYEISERDAAPEIARRDYQIGQASGSGWLLVGGSGVVGGRIGDVVNEVLGVGVGKFLGGAVLDFGEDEGGEGRGLGGGGGGVFGEDGGAVGDAGTRQ